MKIKSNKADKVLEAICVFCIAGAILYLIINWSNLPNEVPMHFDAMGNIDRWGKKSGLLFMPITTCVMYGFLTLVEQFPQMWNTGVKITEENGERVYRTLKYMIKTLKMIVVIDFTFIAACSFTGRSLPIWFTLVFLVLVFGDLIFWVVRLNKVK